MQTIKAEVTIPIPEDFVLIPKEELERLKEQELAGTWWSMKDLERKLNKKHEWIKENILYQPRFRNLLDVKNGGFVYYPERQGQTWSFQASKMADFLEKHFADIFNPEG